MLKSGPVEVKIRFDILMEKAISTERAFLHSFHISDAMRDQIVDLNLMSKISQFSSLKLNWGRCTKRVKMCLNRFASTTPALFAEPLVRARTCCAAEEEKEAKDVPSLTVAYVADVKVASYCWETLRIRRESLVSLWRVARRVWHGSDWETEDDNAFHREAETKEGRQQPLSALTDP